MTYIPRREVTAIIPNKFEAVRVLALECRRLNDEFRAREEIVDRKITTIAVEKLLAGEVQYFDARERREQERSEAMLSAAEGLIDIDEPDFDMDMDAAFDDSEAPAAEGEDAGAAEGADAAAAEGDATDEAPAEASEPAEAVEAAASESEDEAKE